MYMNRNWKSILATILCGAACVLTSTAYADSYPSKPVKILYGFSPGGGGDLFARALAQGLQTELGKPFVVENKTGANGSVAAKQVASAEPDGYTLLFSNPSSLTVNPILQKGISYNVETDFIPISTVVTTPLIIVFNPTNPKLQGVQTLDDMIARIKAKPNLFNYGSSGNGGLLHLAGSQLGLAKGLEMTHIAYRGSPLMELALLGGEIDFAVDILGVAPLLSSGRLKALAVTSENRWRELPEVPTLKELNMPPTLFITAWFGLLAPANTPAPIIKILHAALKKTVNGPQFRERTKLAGDPMVQEPNEFRRQILNELRQNAEWVKKMNITLD